MDIDCKKASKVVFSHPPYSPGHAQTGSLVLSVTVAVLGGASGQGAGSCLMNLIHQTLGALSRKVINIWMLTAVISHEPFLWVTPQCAFGRSVDWPSMVLIGGS